MKLGATRDVVLQEFGLPQESYQLEDGSRVDSWRFTQSGSIGRALSRALLYSVVSAGTIVRSEFGMTPYEMPGIPARTYVVEYDPEGRVRGTMILGRSGFIQQEGSSRTVLGLARVSPGPSRLSPDMERRNVLASIADRHRIAVVRMTFQGLSGHAYLHGDNAADDSAVRAYLDELCSSEYGLVVGRRAGDPTYDPVVELGDMDDRMRHVAFQCSPTWKPSDPLALGTPRRALLGEFGLPDDSSRAEDGSRVDVWDVDLGMLQKLAALTGLSGQGGEVTYIVHYDADDRISATTLLAANGWLRQRGYVLPYDDPARLAAAIGASVTADLVRERELARIAARHGLHVAMLDFDPRKDGGTAQFDGPLANGKAIVQAYVTEICTAEDGLRARQPSRGSVGAGVAVSHWWDQRGKWHVDYTCRS